MKSTWSATYRAKPISWVTTSMVMPSRGQVGHRGQHALDQLGVQRRGGLVEEHHLGLHRQRPGDRDPLLLAAGQRARARTSALCAQADAVELGERALARPRPWTGRGAGAARA